MDNNHPVVIVGAGMAGLSAAQRLAAANIPVLLLDKGKGVGGRMATRRAGNATFDHGAQFFSSKTPDFQRFVKDALAKGVIKEWWPGIPDTHHPRWVGKAGMSAVPKLLAQNLNILNEKRVTQLQEQPDGWHVITDELDCYPASAVLITIPAPQALELLDKSAGHLPDFSHAPLHEIAYHPCMALLATLDRPSSVPSSGGLQIESGIVRWIADNYKKGVSEMPAITVHASPEFSRKHLQSDLDYAGELMLEAVTNFVQPAKVLDVQVHRWLYSLAYQRHPSPFWEPVEMPFPLLFGGDGFGSGNVEGAYLSGLAMADALLKHPPS